MLVSLARDLTMLSIRYHCVTGADDEHRLGFYGRRHLSGFRCRWRPKEDCHDAEQRQGDATPPHEPGRLPEAAPGQRCAGDADAARGGGERQTKTAIS
jgi:hypothetical protein